MNNIFKLTEEYTPKGDQPRAIDTLTQGVLDGKKHQVLLGVTGSGKTFSIANVICNTGKPTLVMAHNKTLAAQLYGEFKELFPDNAVHYFVSYYDYYQPEAYIPHTDTYIEKDASIDERIDRLRHAATSALFERKDVVIVASVSCIYGIANPKDYYGLQTVVLQGDRLRRDDLLAHLVDIQYDRTRTQLYRASFRARGDVVDIFPSHEDKVAVRIEFYGDTIKSIKDIDPITGKTIRKVGKRIIYPGTHYVVPKDRIRRAIEGIKEELEEQIEYLESIGKELERKRLVERVSYDLELFSSMGYCPGIENYSRHLSGRKAGEPPWTLIDYFPDDFLVVIDESHQTIPQVRGMYKGDQSRKASLIEHGFRLPSALDNRPLNFEEFESRLNQVICISATPGPYEMNKAKNRVVEQIIRPTGLADPVIDIRPAQNQVDDLLEAIRETVDWGERVLITTLTKQMAEDLTSYYKELGIKVNYLHSDIDTLERIKIIRDLRLGKFDVLIGINLLREGLDIPEVSLVAIFDADKEGFLRSESSLIQMFGRASRNVRGRVILYADEVTSSMEKAIGETNRRRILQTRYNEINNITPETIKKAVTDVLSSIYDNDYVTVSVTEEEEEYIPPDKIPSLVGELTKQMKKAAQDLEFEKAAALRDRIKGLKEMELMHLGKIA